MNNGLRKTWMGYRRPDGQVGARNSLLLLSGTLYANSVVERLAYMISGPRSLSHIRWGAVR